METLDKDNFQRFKYLLTSYNLEKLLGTCLKVKILFKPQKMCISNNIGGNYLNDLISRTVKC